MKIKCPECGSDSKEKYTQYQLEDHIKEEHILESIAVNYVAKIFKIHELIEYYEHHDLRSGHDSVLKSLLDNER